MDQYTPPSANSGPEAPLDELHDTPETNLEPVEEEEPSRTEYLKSIMPPPKPKRKKWPLLVVLALLVLALLAGGGYLYAKHHKATKPATPKQAASQSVKPSTSASSGSTVHYVSNGHDLNLDFDYPSDWTVAPPSNANSNDQTVTLTSPLTSLTGANGTVVTGKVVLLIRPGTAQLSELSNGGTAAQASAQIAYSKPTSAQHQYPYLTFLHLGSGSNSSFQEVVVTGTLQFTQGETITSSSLSVDPIISASFYSCTTQTCTGSGAVPMSITNDTWQNTMVFQQTLAIFESMQLN